MNQQPISKVDRLSDGSLEVFSIFYTIQGEGPWTGQPAIFVRLYGCNLQCPACDTDYTSENKRYTVNELVSAVYELKEDEFPNAPQPMLVITGGEPFRQNISPFCNIMVAEGWIVQVESNGTLPPGMTLSEAVHIVVSPKTGKMNDIITQRITALKYVVKAGCIDRSDGLPIRSLDHSCSPVVAKPPHGFRGKVYLQPMDDGTIRGQRENMVAAINACKKYGHILQIQTHKVAGIE